ENSANKKRIPTLVYKEGDKVWLDLCNYNSLRLKKSLDAKHAKYIVDKVISLVSIHLSRIPSNIYLVFYTDLLWPASHDPLPRQ
ncbi:hypothetical protein K431DRAFT_236067, partial [Polychaeton citri CBS 116435]